MVETVNMTIVDPDPLYICVNLSCRPKDVYLENIVKVQYYRNTEVPIKRDSTLI